MSAEERWRFLLARITRIFPQLGADSEAFAPLFTDGMNDEDRVIILEDITSRIVARLRQELEWHTDIRNRTEKLLRLDWLQPLYGDYSGEEWRPFIIATAKLLDLDLFAKFEALDKGSDEFQKKIKEQTETVSRIGLEILGNAIECRSGDKLIDLGNIINGLSMPTGGDRARGTLPGCENTTPGRRARAAAFLLLRFWTETGKLPTKKQLRLAVQDELGVEIPVPHWSKILKTMGLTHVLLNSSSRPDNLVKVERTYSKKNSKRGNT